MNNPKKQHYVPQTYLRQFTEIQGNLYIYDKVKQEIRKQKPSAVGYNKHFYTVEIEGEKDYFIEKFLAEKVDVLYTDLLTKISNQSIFNSKDRYDLGLFLAAQYLRTPAQRKNYNQMIESNVKQIGKITYSMKRNTNQLKAEMKDEEFARIIEKGDYDIKVPPENSLAFLVSFVEEMAEMLAKQNIVVLKASKKSEFITSDNPYTMVKEKWAAEWEGFGVINTTKIFPLSPQYLLLLKDVGNKMIYPPVISSKDIRVYNQQIATWSDRYLFARNEYLLRSLIKKMPMLK